ncbi:MAG: ASKHA domain-containing protein [Eubacteriales bacterium]
MKYYNLGNISAGLRLMDVIAEAHTELHTDAPCGGRGTCGKCRVTVSGAVQPPDETERKFLSETELAAGIRLACRCITSGGEVNIAAYETDTGSAIQIEGAMSFFVPAPLCGGYGIAVDIGTTTVAVYLCDMMSCRVVNTGAFQNPQRAHGADVITRIGKIIEDKDNLAVLQQLIIDAINKTVTGFGIPAQSINAAVITANTTMLHIFAGYDPSGIANAPFTPATLFGFKVSAVSLGLAMNPEADVHLMPCFAAYVGGDIATGMIAADVDKSDGLNLYIDIGTNGEMGLGGSDGICLCATAAGPAFEGAHIECGMGGVEGAVNRVYYENGEVKFDIIGGGTPTGICGSGLIDAVAVMVDCGALDETGRIDKIYEDDRFMLDYDNNIYISGKDIREVQLAKSAVCAGIMTLIDDAGASIADIKRVIVAGGFGAHIDPHSAAKIGLIPAEFEDKVETVGNTAGTGAVLYLLSADARERINGVLSISRYLELSCNEFFMDEYVERMMF